MPDAKLDLVERLRADREAPTRDPNIVQVAPPSPLALEAAEEIERLRSILAKCAGHSLEWSTGVRSATEACADITSALMHAVKLPQQSTT